MANSPAEALQSTLESGNLESASPLVSAYGEYIKEQIRAADTLEERLAIASEASAFLHDRLHLARVLRSHLAAQLVSVSRLSSYAIAPQHKSSWNLEG